MNSLVVMYEGKSFSMFSVLMKRFFRNYSSSLVVFGFEAWNVLYNYVEHLMFKISPAIEVA